MAARRGRRGRGRRRHQTPDAAGAGTPVEAAARRLGIEQLRPEQERILDAALAGRDALMVLPTGFGKSACYQVPSMVLPKPVVVISPMLALLRDQQQKLDALGVPCVRVDGGVRGRRRKEALARIEEGGSILVMTTPETLGTADLFDALRKGGVSLVAVDEAHCISEWGHDFRPSYLGLGARIHELDAPPVLALTATATPRVREAIMRALRMRDPDVVAASPHRSNLAFEVIPCEGDMRLRGMVRLLKRLRRPGIVYCATRREVDDVYTILRRFGMPSHRYHAGMTATERNKEQTRFMQRGRRTVMVATSAFGLGIDKPDVRFVLHFQGPASLEQYVQEAGRGGRDGKKSNCLLLYADSDRQIHEALLARSRVRPDQLYKLASTLGAWSGESRDPTLEALALSADLGPRIAAALLTKVEEAGLVTRDGDVVHILGDASTIEEDTRALAAQFETLRTQDSRRLDALAQYVHSDGCRAVHLREYFGEEPGEPCGLCDVCLDAPDRSEGFFLPLNAPKQPLRRGRGRGRGRGDRRGRSPRAARPAQAADASGGDAEARKRPKGRRRRGGRRRRRGTGRSPEGGPTPEA